MHAKLFAITAFVTAAVAVAMPQNNAQCNVGSVHCCNSVQQASNSSTRQKIESLHSQGLLSAVNVDDVLNNVTGEVGFDCTAVNAVGSLGGNNCAAQPVCCTGNNFSGLVVVGCSPINIG